MEVGQWYTIAMTGKAVKKELFQDGKVRVSLQNMNTTEFATVLEDTKSTNAEEPVTIIKEVN